MTDVFKGGVENIDGSLHADGSINARDLVKLNGVNQVIQADTNGADGYGVAMYDASSGDAIAVATVGAKVEVNATGVSAGDLVTSNGGNTAGQVQTATGAGDEIVGKALTGTTNGVATIMIGISGDNN